MARSTGDTVSLLGQLIRQAMVVGRSFSTPLSTSRNASFASACRLYATSSTRLLLGPNSKLVVQRFWENVSHRANFLGVALTQQCSRVMALRLRRAYQIILLYQRIYGEKALMQKIRSQVHLRSRPLLTLFSAVIFQWEKERIEVAEMQRCREEMQEVHRLIELSHLDKAVAETTASYDDLSEWESVVDKTHFKVWRRLIPDSNLYQYRVFGHFGDIPPRAFYNTQVDLAYFKDWDKNTLDVRVVDKDDVTDSEVVYWVYKFPYPMYARDYVYVRRCKVDPESNTMIIIARATEHPNCPVDPNNVRISTYASQMVIKPHTTFEENGLDYVLTYFDDPQTNFPPMCYNWMASTGVHEFLERVHRAARKKHQEKSETTASRIDNSSENSLYSKMVHQ